MTTSLNAFQRTAALTLAASIAVALITFVSFRLQLNLATAVCLYLIVVVLLSLQGNFFSSAIVSFLAVGCLAYLFTSPVFSLRVADPFDLLALIVFLITSAAITHFVSRVRKSKEGLREQANLLNLTHDTVFARGMDDVITYWNRGAEELYGWASEEAKGQVSHRLTQTIFPAPLEEINAQLIRTGRWEGELVHTRRDGARIVVTSRWALQRDERGRPVAVLETNNDITERKRAEESLRRSEYYLAEAQRLSHMGSWAVDYRGQKTLYWSEEMFRICGLDPRRSLPHKEESFRLVHPKDRDRLSEIVERAYREKADFAADCRMVVPDGTLKHIHMIGHAVLNETGEVVEYAGTTMDVTERKRAEEELRERANLLDLTHDAIFVRDLESVITYWSRGATELYGWKTEETIGQVTHEILHTVFPKSVEVIESQLLATGRWDGELIHTKKDGTPLVVASRWSLQKDDSGKPIAILETNNDITERRRAEEALRESEEQWKAVFENNPTMYFVVDAPGIMLSVNAFGAEQLGYAPDDLVGKRVLDIFYEPDREPVRRNIERCFDQLNRSMTWEARKVRKDGKVLWVRETARAVLLKNRPVILVACEDITEHKRAEDALQKTQADLAHVSRLTTLGELTASIAHEVNQPIAAAVTNAGACLRWLSAQPPDMERARQALERIIRDGGRAGQVIGRVRKLVKKAPQRKDWVDVGEIIHEVIALAQSEIQRNRVSLTTQLSDGLPLVLGDRIQLQQVILNLIINGVEAMSGGKEGPRELLIRAGKNESNGLLVEVADSGPGIDPANLAHLFDSFYTTKPDGMGMGLSISRSIVEAHGGRLSVTANKPHGAVFQFILPVDGGGNSESDS